MITNKVGNSKKIMIHVLKTFPPSMLNAGEDGTQKTGEYGGVLRARISGYNIAHNVRTSPFLSEVAHIGVRTRALPSLVLDEMYRLKNEDSEFAKVTDDFLMEAAKKLTKFGASSSKDNDPEDEGGGKKGDELITKQVLFFTLADVKTIADVMRKEILKSKGNLKDFKKIALDDISGMSRCVKNPISPDMALFGRMVTSNCLVPINSAVQISNALGTHSIHKEIDFYICMDDLNSNGMTGRKGSAMADRNDFNGSCYYSYAAIDLGVLEENLSLVQGGEDMLCPLVDAFIKAFVYEYSKTRQSRYAAQVFPDMVMVEVQEAGPTYSYVGAYKKPVPTFGDAPDVTKKSVEAFRDFVNMTYNNHDIRKVKSAFFAPEYAAEIHPEKCQICDRFTDVIDFVNEQIKE